MFPRQIGGTPLVVLGHLFQNQPEVLLGPGLLGKVPSVIGFLWVFLKTSLAYKIKSWLQYSKHINFFNVEELLAVPEVLR